MQLVENFIFTLLLYVSVAFLLTFVKPWQQYSKLAYTTLLFFFFLQGIVCFLALLITTQALSLFMTFIVLEMACFLITVIRHLRHTTCSFETN